MNKVKNLYQFNPNKSLKELFIEILKCDSCCLNIEYKNKYFHSLLPERKMLEFNKKELNLLSVEKLTTIIPDGWEDIEIIDTDSSDYGIDVDRAYLYTLSRKLMDIKEYGKYVIYNSNYDEPNDSDYFIIDLKERIEDKHLLKNPYNMFNNIYYMNSELDKLELSDEIIKRFEIDTRNIHFIKIEEGKEFEVVFVDRYYNDIGCGIYDIQVNIIDGVSV